MSEIRAFVAVIPSNSALDGMEEYLKRLRPLARLRWVTRPQLHLTLRFLGERTPEVLEKVKEALAAVRASPFEVVLGRAGAFPSLTRPRVLWLGVERGSERLADLAERVESAVERAGLEREARPFRAHLTLARAEGNPLPEALVAALREPPPDLSWRCGGISLMRSELTPRGAIYAPLASVEWAG